MACDVCLAPGKRHCTICKRENCAKHAGHTQNGELHRCPRCTRKNKPVLLEKYSDRSIGLALALPNEPMFTGDKTLEENYNDPEYSDAVNADEHWDDEDNAPPEEPPTGVPLSPEELV